MADALREAVEELPTSPSDEVGLLREGLLLPGCPGEDARSPPGISGAASSRMRIAAAGSTAVLALAGFMLVAASAVTHLRGASAPPEFDRVVGEAGLPSCEVCPVGRCDRGQGTTCHWFEPPEDPTGAYHCEVKKCSDVPKGSTLSACWQYNGQNFFSVAQKSAKYERCLKVAQQTSASTATRTATTTQTRTSTSTPEPTSTSTKTATATATSTVTKTTTKKKAEAELRVLDLPSLLAAPLPLATPPPPVAPQPIAVVEATLPPMPAVASIFDTTVEEIADEAAKVNTYSSNLTSYWDAGSCGILGEAGDDNNNYWCGGLVYEPDCAETVHVNLTLCDSGKAKLAWVSGRDTDTPTAAYWEDGCSYMYFAQYECIASTTTTSSSTSSSSSTTSMSSTTSTSSSTSSFTSSSTVSSTTSSSSTGSTTTTTTVRTTTHPEEGEMLQHQAALDNGFDLGFPESCREKFTLPDAPQLASDLNGLQLPDVCFRSKGPHYVQVIGDWGGIMDEHGPKPASQRDGAAFVKGVDDSAQQRVAAQMAWRAKTRAPDYILSVGDHFYWQGLDVQCGIAPAWQVIPTGQFQWNFEAIYKGKGLDGKPWLSVLGNHDYGGYLFNKGWDQQISYSWGESGRWVMPAQYWRTKVWYPGFSVDYYFLDTNVVEAGEPHADQDHNICSLNNLEDYPDGEGCGEEGPKDIWDCPGWFARLWEEQKPWLENALDKSTADWQIIVTHFPPNWMQDYWVPLSRKYGVDLFVCGHLHDQELHYMEPSNFLRPTAWLVSGGGGGITSEGIPNTEGYDDQYGFFELTFTKDVIEIQGISHGGMRRVLSFLKPVPRDSAAPGPLSPRVQTGNSNNKSNSGKADRRDHTLEFKK